MFCVSFRFLAARLFKITFPAIDCYFSGTGDMFGALTVVRMRETVHATPGLDAVPSWISDDSVDALDLPLARAADPAYARGPSVDLHRTALDAVGALRVGLYIGSAHDHAAIATQCDAGLAA